MQPIHPFRGLFSHAHPLVEGHVLSVSIQDELFQIAVQKFHHNLEFFGHCASPQKHHNVWVMVCPVMKQEESVQQGIKSVF